MLMMIKLRCVMKRNLNRFNNGYKPLNGITTAAGDTVKCDVKIISCQDKQLKLVFKVLIACTADCKIVHLEILFIYYTWKLFQFIAK